MPLVQSLVFLILSAAFAVQLWYDRVDGGASGTARAATRTGILIAVPFLAFVMALWNQHDARLTLRVLQLRIPASVVAATGEVGLADYLVVADQSEGADLIVPPYIDRALSRVATKSVPRVLFRVRAAPIAGPSGMVVHLTATSHAPEVGDELPGMGVEIDGQKVEPGVTVDRQVWTARSIGVTISRIDLDGVWQPRRRFAIQLRQEPAPAVELTLDSPLTSDAGTCVRPRLRLAPKSNSDDPQFREPENLQFDALGAGGAHPVLNPTALGPVSEPSSLCASSEHAFTWPTNAEPNDARLGLISHKLYLPWYCLSFVTLILLATHLLCVSGWREPSAERTLVPLLQWLLILRLIIAVAGAYNDIKQPMWTVTADGLLSLVCLPVLAVWTLREGEGAGLRRLMMGFAALLCFSLLGVAIASATLNWRSIPVGLTYVTLSAVVWRAFQVDGPAPLVRIARWIAHLVAERPRERAGEDPWAGKQARDALISAAPRRFTMGLRLIWAFVALRCGLAMLGYLIGSHLTERVFRVPLSLVYVPGIILGFALMLSAAHEVPAGRAARSVVAAFVASYIVVPAFTRDFGMIFVFGWPLAAVLAWFLLRRLRTWRWSGAWLMPLVFPLVLVLSYGAMVAWDGDMPKPREGLGPHMAEVAGWSPNGVRMLAFLAPRRLEQLGTLAAYESMDQSAGLEPLTRSVIGEGYLAPPNIVRPLLDYQYSDNLAAIHILWPLGRVGALALLIVLAGGIASIVPFRLAELRAPAPAWPVWVSVLAAATLFWSACYMIAANLNWVPFTGRNIYLLAVTSGGDLAEGLVLLLMFAFPYVTSGRGENDEWKG